MSKSNKKQKTVKATVSCGWNGCKQNCESVWILDKHLTEHLKEYVPTDIYECPWHSCKFSSKCCEEMKRHIYYHGYYESILAQGRLELTKLTDLPACKAACRTDIIPPMLRDYKCEWQDCERTFNSVVEFQDHIEQHAYFEYEFTKLPDEKQPKTQCQWNYCKKQFDYKYRLIEHIRTHTNKKNVACPQCGEVFRTKSTLYDHMRRQPDSDTPQKFQCAQCFKCFMTEKLLRSHLLKHINCHKCSMCDMTCSSVSSLAVHVRYRHLREKPFKCPQCEHRCVRQNDLKKHMQYVHVKEKQLCQEPGCNYAVLSASLLKRHFLETHGNNPFIYVCHCCEKPFKSGKSLSYHLMKKHDFHLPSGHKRFNYTVDENGYYRLETMRIESLEVSNQILATPNSFDTNTTNETACSLAFDRCDSVSFTTNHDETRVLSVTADFSDLRKKRNGLLPAKE